MTLTESGIRLPLKWAGGENLGKLDHPVRVRVNWKGVRPEDARLFAVYVTLE